MIIQESVSIKAPLDVVYNSFEDLRVWKKILPDVIDVNMIYEDSYHQEFTMTVDRPTGPETVRAIRYCNRSNTIELFQPVPPPLFNRMSGEWVFEQDGENITVTATRNWEPKEKDKADSIAKKLTEILSTNLNLFKTEIENLNG